MALMPGFSLMQLWLKSRALSIRILLGLTLILLFNSAYAQPAGFSVLGRFKVTQLNQILSVQSEKLLPHSVLQAISILKPTGQIVLWKYTGSVMSQGINMKVQYQNE